MIWNREMDDVAQLFQKTGPLKQYIYSAFRNFESNGHFQSIQWISCCVHFKMRVVNQVEIISDNI